ncbi:MAG: hydantoinase B/oxoprolinase family protein [Deltaproteobacteria bacterium]|nr:MAG: hydantoinase B/oxoprolinase family protein [Deltaproteobacteria bacterium]
MGEIIIRSGSESKGEMNISPDLPLYTIDEEEVIEKLDPITYEVISHRLWAINDEQAKAIERISGSPVVSIAGDFNVVIADELGSVVATGQYVQWHSSILDLVMKDVLKTRSRDPGIREGDMFLCNDPWRGGGHQNDVALVCPQFYQGKLFCWTGSILHQIDVGGVDFGSVCLHAKDVYDEPTPIPPVKAVENWKLRPDIEEWYLRASRLPSLVALDLRAQIVGNKVVGRRIKELIDKYGADTVMGVFKKLIKDAEAAFRKRLKEFPNGTWHHVEYIEKAREGENKTYRIVCAMTKQDDTLVFDTSETDSYPPGGGLINITFGCLRGCVLTFILPLLCYDMPWATGGICRALTFKSEKGSIVDAEWPAPVSAIGAVASFMAQNLAQQCVTKMMTSNPKYRKEVVTPHFGTWAFSMSSGIDQRGGPWIYFWMDPLCGCMGARSFKDGVDTGGAFCIAMSKVPNIEQTELFYPVLYIYRKEKRDSGGAGKFRGGCGLQWCIIPHKTDRIDHIQLALHAGHPASDGLCGGYPGAAVSMEIKENSDIQKWFDRKKIPSDIEELSGDYRILDFKGSFTQHKDTVYSISTCGASGYGDPIERKLELVRRDVINDYVSLDSAKKVYGVALNEETLEVDGEATEELREKMLDERGTI